MKKRAQDSELETSDTEGEHGGTRRKKLSRLNELSDAESLQKQASIRKKVHSKSSSSTRHGSISVMKKRFQDSEVETSDTEGENGGTRRKNLSRRVELSDAESLQTSDDENLQKQVSCRKKVNSKNSSTCRQGSSRVKWTKDALQVLRKEFNKFFRLKKAPDEESIKKAMRFHDVLKSRTVAQIKSRILYLIQTGR